MCNDMSFADDVFEWVTDTSAALAKSLNQRPTIIDHRPYEPHYKKQSSLPVGSIETTFFTLTFYMSMTYQGLQSRVRFSNDQHNHFLPPQTATKEDRAENLATLALRLLHL